MDSFLYEMMDIVARIHAAILSLNDTYEYNFSDKQLHFLVIGFLGVAMILVVHPIFSSLARHNHVMAISWIYVFTLIIVITFAIEIGQRISHTGTMEFGDIMFGVVGFICFFAFYMVIKVLKDVFFMFIGRKEQRVDNQESKRQD